jgi:hypothetical protein
MQGTTTATGAGKTGSAARTARHHIDTEARLRIFELLLGQGFYTQGIAALVKDAALAAAFVTGTPIRPQRSERKAATKRASDRKSR